MPIIGTVPLDRMPTLPIVNSAFSALGFKGGSSVHKSPSGSVHGGAGGSFGPDTSLYDLANNAKKLFRPYSPAAPAAPASPAAPAAPSGGAPSQPQLADYLDAPWASAYGMSKETAYSEAMENTAYRRAVTDMQKAGLNPAVIFGAGNGYTAGSPSYVRSGSSGSVGSGSGYSRRSSGSGKSSGKLFSSTAYATLSALGGLAGVAATGTAGGYWIGLSLTQGAMSAANLLSRR